MKSSAHTNQNNSFLCGQRRGTKWILFTYTPSIATLTTWLELNPEWHMLIISRNQSFLGGHLNRSRIVLLNKNEQNMVNYRFIRMRQSQIDLRQGIGILLAIECGAQMIFDAQSFDTSAVTIRQVRAADIRMM